MAGRAYEALVTTPVELVYCSSCSSVILTGYVSGILTRVDLGALDDALIVAATLLGRCLYRVRRLSSRRSAELVYWRPSEPLRTGETVVADHVCPPGRQRAAQAHSAAHQPPPHPSVAAHLTGWRAAAEVDASPPY